MYESSWSNNVEEWVKEFKEMIKNRKNLILIRGGANFYHYDPPLRRK